MLLCNSMEKILERYERYSYAERQLVATDLDSQVGPYYFIRVVIFSGSISVLWFLLLIWIELIKRVIKIIKVS